MRQTNSRPTKGRPKLPAEERKSILVSVKLDIDQNKEITEKAFVARPNSSEYMRHAALHCKVVERLKPKDVKAIRDLQCIAENLNRNAKFISAIIKGGASDEQFIRTYKEMIACKNFVLSLIKIYRDTPDSL